MALKPYERNPRKITATQKARLGETMARLGDLSGIVHDLESGQVVGGNQRVGTMDAWGATPTITETFDPPTAQGTVALGYLEWHGERFAYRAVRWTPEQCAEANIVANAAGGSFDWEILREDFPIDLLQSCGLDADALTAMNEGSEALSALFAPEPTTETADAGELVDRAAELQEKWQVKRGDLWEIPSKSVQGKSHRILCGDSTNAEDVARVMGGEKAQLVFTDPPYGMNLDADFSGMVGIGRGNKYANVIGDDHDYDPEHIFRDFGYCKEIFLWGADYYAERLPRRNEGSWLVWDKMAGGEGVNDNYDKMFGSNFELGWSKAKHKRAMVRILWKGIFGLQAEDIKARLHPTQKPVELSRWFIERFSEAEVIVADIFAGIGGSLVACEQTGRIGRGIEIEPKYVAVCLERLSALGLTCERIT